MADRFKLTLIGRVLHLVSRSIEALITQIPRPRIWNVEGRVRGRNLGNGRFQFDFDNEKDLQAVLNRRLCHFNQWSFPLERWEPFTRDDFPNPIPFWVHVTRVPVHFWNDGTFTEIAKALGKKTGHGRKERKIQISVNIDMPLQFERKFEFPNGDIGKVSFLYVGLHRYCFTCKMISHDENSCMELTEEQRQQRRLEILNSNASGPQRQLPFDVNQDRRTNGKRPRSPTLEVSRRSPPRKIQTYTSYWRNMTDGSSRDLRLRETDQTENLMSRNNSSQRKRAHPSRRSPTRQAVWSRLDRVHSHSRSDYHRTSMQYNGRDRNWDVHSRARGVTEWTVPRTGSLNERRQQEWRPREHQAIKNTPKDNGDNQVNLPSDGLRDKQDTSRVEHERSDSQRTVSEQLGNVRMMGDNRSGHLVIHRNETDEEKRRRLKGKAILTSNADTPMSKPKDAESSVLLIGQNTILIRDPRTRVTQNQQSSALQEEVNDHTNYGHEVGVAQIQKILPSLGTIEVGEDGLLNEENAKLVTMTAEDEAEVDKLVLEFDDVMMDENMRENDDLLVDEPGYDAEQIDAISQLYPM